VNNTSTSTAPQQYSGIPLRQLWAILTPWRWSLTLVGVSVLLGAVVELVPPLLVKQIVDEHLKLGRSEACSGSQSCTCVPPRQCRVWGF
jgi:hypothetical protein